MTENKGRMSSAPRKKNHGSSSHSVVSPRLTSVACPLLRRPGGYGEGVPPDPIPNSTVKFFSVDGTASQGVGE